MIRRIIDVLLLGAVLVGAFMAWKSGSERARLQSEYRRLTAITGNMAISDPTMIHVLALEKDEPLNFMWRVYFPAGANISVSYTNGMMGSSSSVGPREGIAHVRIRENEDGRIELYTSFPGGSSRSTLGNRELADFLRGRWDQLIVEQLGARGTVAVDPAQYTRVLKISLPKKLEAEAAAVQTGLPNYFVPVLLEIGFGTKPQTTPK